MPVRYVLVKVLVIDRAEDPIGASAALLIEMDFMNSVTISFSLENGANVIHGIAFPLIL